MSYPNSADVGVPLSGRRGLRGRVYSRGQDTTGYLTVRLDDGAEYCVPTGLLHHHDDGTYSIELDTEELSAYDAAHRISPPALGTDEVVSFVHAQTVPILAEEVTLGKRRHESVVRIAKKVLTRDVIVDDPLIRDTFEIRRVPVNKIIAEPVEPRQEGDVFIVPIFEEVLVTEKRLLLREEVHIVRTREEVHEPRRVTLRREEVEVQRRPRGESTEQQPGRTGDK